MAVNVLIFLIPDIRHKYAFSDSDRREKNKGVSNGIAYAL